MLSRIVFGDSVSTCGGHQPTIGFSRPAVLWIDDNRPDEFWKSASVENAAAIAHVSWLPAFVYEQRLVGDCCG
jgi:hypothetical protein